MCTRGPAMSVRAGATTRSTPAPSRSQPSRFRTPPVRPRDAVTATVSTPRRATALGTLVSEPTTGTVDPSAASPGGMQAPTTCSPAYGSRCSSATRASTSSRPPTTRTRWDHVLERPPRVVQRLACAPAADQEEQRPGDERHRQHETRELELDHVAGDRDQAPEVHAGAHDPSVLVPAHAEHPAVVRPGHREHRDPGDGEQRPDHEVGRELDVGGAREREGLAVEHRAQQHSAREDDGDDGRVEQARGAWRGCAASACQAPGSARRRPGRPRERAPSAPAPPRSCVPSLVPVRRPRAARPGRPQGPRRVSDG